MAGCGILGDGEVNIVTAPPIVNTKVVVLDYFGNNDDNRFRIGGTTAFYLLPGIENHPDYLQDFSCLDYTNDGYFVYYYCAPAYITPAQIIAYKGTSGTLSADTDMWPAINRDKQKSTCDAMIFMAYNPYTRAYKVIDAQSYSKDTADSDNKARAKDTDGSDISLQVSTGIEFYSNHTYDFHTLSHCYGCRIARTNHYYIFDQNGGATVYDEHFNVLQSTQVGSIIHNKVLEETELIKKAASGDEQSTAQIVSDLGDGGDEMKEAIKEMQSVSGKTYNTGQTIKDLHLSSLVKSAVMDSNGVMYLTLMLYTGESPWATDVLYNRVLMVYEVDLGGDMVQFICRNERYEDQIAYMKANPLTNYDALKNGSTRIQKKRLVMNHDGTMNAHYEYYYVDGSDSFGTFQYQGPDGLFISHIAGVNEIGAPGQGTGYWRNFFEQYIRALSGTWGIAMDATVANSGNWGAYMLYTLLFRHFNLDKGLLKDNEYAAISSLLPYVAMGLHATKIMQVLWHAYFSNRIKDAGGDVTAGITGQAASFALQSYMNTIKAIIDRFKSEYGNDPTQVGHKEFCQLSSFPDTPPYKAIEKFLLSSNMAPTMGKWNASTHMNDTNGLPTREQVDAAPQRLGSSRYDFGMVMNDVFGSSTYLPAQSYAIVHTYSALKTSWHQLALSTFKIDFFPPSEVEQSWQEDQKSAWVEPCEWSASIKDKDGRLVVDGSKYPIAYRLCFPKGTTALFAQFITAEGSTNSSLGLGALLFADDAKMTDKVNYTTKIRYVRETGIYFQDSNIPGAAVDTGCLEVEARSENPGTSSLLKGFQSEILLVLTEEGVKFYMPTIFTRCHNDDYDHDNDIFVVDWTSVNPWRKILSIDCTYGSSDAYFFTYAQMLTSTGFTSHMEGTQAESSDNLSNVLQDKTGDNSANQTVKDSAAKLSKTLNSSRVGTLQAATSFTALSNTEYLASSYDSGLVVLNVDTRSLGSVDVLPIRTGSYYQSFPVSGKSGHYKLLGFDTEEYQYGSLDLARARVYDENLAEGKNAVYATAMLQFLDQYAIDYVRRLYRTRRDKDNNMVVINYEDDYSGEAASEKRLFAATSSEEDAISELKSLESKRHAPHTEAAEEYLRMLRRRVAAQQTALNEIFDITMASKLGETKLKTDPYWVDVRARLQ
ncbi:MAG: hypothetical protein IJT34_11360, partial [Butyrivibrio sp.]|nr:hypothetical protein [Butyrivibrio sp.]